MATRSITNPTLNKIGATEYNSKVAAGLITDTMIEEQIWLDSEMTVPVQHKLVGIEEGAQVNKIEGIKANGVTITPDANKIVNIDCVGEANVITSIKKEGVALTVTDKSVNIIETDPTVPAWAKTVSKPTYTFDEITNKPNFAVVATTGSYNDLTNKPTVPTKTSDLANDSGFITGYTESDPTVPAWAKQSSKPTYTYNEITGKPTLSTVATSGNYNDLSNRPTLSAVATSGNYNDLVNKPTIGSTTLVIWG